MSPMNTEGFAHPARNVDALGIDAGMTVVDFGSGSGAYVMAIAERLKNEGRVYAVDVQQDLLRRIKNDAHKKGYTNVEIIWNDLERPGASKVADRHADVVLISNLLFQLEDKKSVFTEAWRILKATGRLAVIDWSESFGGMGPVKNDVVKKDTVLELATAAGFSLQNEFNAGAHHYGLVFKLVAPKV